MVKHIGIFALTIFLTACGAGSGKNLDNSGLPVNSSASSAELSSSSANSNSSALSSSTSSVNSSSSSNAGVTLANLQENIFGAICSGCHTGGTAPRGLRLDSEENSYTYLVNQTADEVPALMRVNPGKPDESYIIRKLEGAAGIVGAQMPLGGPYLTQQQINKVRDWIANGAPRSGSGVAATKISKVFVVSSTHEETQVQDFSASMHFSREIQPDSVDVNSLQLSYIPTSSSTPIVVGNFGVLVLDQSIEIFSRQVPVDATNIALEIHSENGKQILDVEERSFDGNGDDYEGGEYRYEHPIK